MINPTNSGANTGNDMFQLGTVENGCCGTPLTECGYSGSTSANVDAITSLTLTRGGVSETLTIAQSITQNSTKEAYDAIAAALHAAGLTFNDNDLKVYNNSFATDTMTFEFISGLPITALVINGATAVTITEKCNKYLTCMYKDIYTPTEAISIIIDNVDLGLTTYATGALLKAAIDAALSSASIVGYADVRASGSDVELWLWLADVNNVYIDGTRVTRANCQMKFI